MSMATANTSLSPHPAITHLAAHLPRKLHLFGYPIAHSVGPYIHTFVAESVGLPWKCTHFETRNLSAVVAAMRAPDFQAGAVTMPFKLPIGTHLDEIDKKVRLIGAVHTINKLPDGKLVGSNTDASGIRDTLAEISSEGRWKPGMVIGVGGASRAAVYALHAELGCSKVYLVNRDPARARQLVDELVKSGYSAAREGVVVLESVKQARSLETPFYAVGCVPNNTPETDGEKTARAIADELFRADRVGAFLDMCFKPRVTQLVEIAEPRGWKTVNGIEVLGLQLLEQWRLWLGDNVPLPASEARSRMRALATGSAALNTSSSTGFSSK